ncbi:MAG: response regulator [Myxococcales bacterium]|nr:response regulator [Myxococcales bacterium]
MSSARSEEGESTRAPVLIVDDHPGNVLSLEAVLDSERFDLVAVHSGADALRECARREFAVVLLDVEMPGMDGFKTASRMRQLKPEAQVVPIIFVTGSDEEPARLREAYSGGAVDFIQKPLDPAAIRAKVSVFAELYRSKQRLSALERRASRALQAIGDLAIALSDARSTEDVAAIIVEHGMRVAQADTCSLYLLDDQERTLELIGHRGVAPELVAQTRQITERASPETFAGLRTGAGLWVETAQEYARLFPSLVNAPAQGRRARAFWSMPLRVEGRGVGLIGMGFYDERRFADDERSLVDTLVKQCAQALLRAVRLQREEQVRERFATTLRSIGDGVIATDTHGCVTLMNAVAERLTGWSENEARGRALGEVFPIFSEETRAESESPVSKVLREGTVVGLANHTVLRTRNGHELSIDDSAAPIRDGKGQLLGVVLVFRDATIEKREHARRAFLARAGEVLASSLDYRTTLTAVAQLAVPRLADWCTVALVEPGALVPQQLAVAHVDPNKVVWARALAEKYPPNPNARTGAPQVIRSGQSELYSEIPAALLEAGAQDAEHLRMIRELNLESAIIVPLPGRTHPLGAMTFIYADSGRRYTPEDLAFAEDFARRAALAIENARAFKDADEARAEERRLRREADIANRAKDEFLATVSHELRTPLNAILGWTVSTRARKPPDDIDRALAIIERNARRQVRLIEDVLDVSRVISGKLSLSLAPTGIASVVEGAIDAVTPAAEAKGIDIQVEAEPSLAITADADRLQQVVWNLLTNAVKFSPKGARVRVRAYREGSDLSVSVSDTGEGIAPDVLPYIFDPFRQADASTTRKHGGLGLGLAIVKQLVTAHGGTVEARSDGPGHGATFVVRLPARAAVAAVEEAAVAVRQASTIELQARPPRLDGLTVLVVDDEEDARLIIEHVLSDLGAKVVKAASVPQALEAFATSTPDVIVSDIGMPDMDGYMFLRKVRALPPAQGGRTPAVALTAFARKEDAQRAFAAGFQMHVPKPVEPAQLAIVVANLGGRTVE